MAKIAAIVPICIIALSGCALSDTAQMSNEPVAAPSLTTEEATPAVETAWLDGTQKPMPPAVHSVTADDVRRVQTRMREVGLDAGPLDGRAGTKTKMAFSRLQAGCAKIEALDSQHPLTRVRTAAAGEMIMERNDVMKIQTELRAAGFNPGATDGVYGVRTKALVSHLPAACLAAKEFHKGLDVSAAPLKPDLTARTPIEPAKSAFVQPMASKPDEAAREASAVQTAQPREDIRILQLRLRDAGFDPGPFDGIMGAKTKAALAQYEASQRNSKIKTSLPTTKISGQY
jgi:peptidoglycan hydrolase-like protein with peptidoglycan-binding domain